MNDVVRGIAAGVLCSAGLMLAACGSSSNSASTPITVGGTVTGLTPGASIELTNNGGAAVALTANGSFTFSDGLEIGASYDVTIAQQPTGESCKVSNGTGTVGAAVANILITCTANGYTISGSLAGLLSGQSLIIQDNGADSATLSANGNFTFSSSVSSGSNYAVTILTQPAGQSCAVTNGSGTVGSENITNVAISCSDNTYNVGVTVSGVNASGLHLENNGSDSLSVVANGTFNFNTPVASGSPYAVTIASQPQGETCTVANGSGTIASSNVSNVTVSCIAQLFPISGTLTGLLSGGSIILQDNGTNNTTLSANGTFSFSSPVASGSSYSVTILAQPAGQSCAVTRGSGTVAGGAVSNVSIACSDDTYNIGVAVSGVIRSGLVLEDNGADNLTVSTNGSFNFATPVPGGSPYAITLLAQPAGESCTVSNGSGTVGAANITGIPVQCTPLQYSISGALTGLMPSSSLMVEDNGGNVTTLSANGSFSFSGQIASGSTYAVTVSTQPPGQSCAVTNGSGTVVSSNVTTVAIACSDNTYNIGVAVSGLAGGTSLVLQDNSGDNLTVSTNGSLNFATPIPSGSTYAVTVLTQPTGQTCTVTGGSGTVTSSDVSGIPVSCVATYTIGGSVSGLTSGSLVLQDNGGDALTVSANGSFTFATPLTVGSAYAVSILTQPAGQTCAIASGSGSVSAANVTTVTVTCGHLWIWVSGSNSAGASGVYGTQRQASSSNVPGARNSSVTWTDPSGNLWLFGGYGNDSFGITGYLNDLWEFNSTAGTWEWVSGSNTVGASGTYGSQGMPGARSGAISWTDASGNLWLFGGLGSDSMGSTGFLNDLWEFSTTAGTWEWVGGSTSVGAPGMSGMQGVASTINVPGARYLSTAWTDAAGNLWLFGGYGYDSVGGYGLLNDLWEFNPIAGTWEWVSGSNSAGASGVYGNEGAPASGNVPGARQNAMSWIDAAGNFWLFGGDGNASSGSTGYLNDLWEFNPTAGTWDWVSGSNSAGAIGVYGTAGVAASGNVPGARYGAISWTDATGNRWLFGGYGIDSLGSTAYLNDLWKFNSSAGGWEWVSASNTINALGVFGTQGVASTSNVPGARYLSTAWTDASGNLWLFGGLGLAASTDGNLNDLWEYVP
jgi:N-acetylneuraminic acid mutarotase